MNLNANIIEEFLARYCSIAQFSHQLDLHRMIFHRLKSVGSISLHMS